MAYIEMANSLPTFRVKIDDFDRAYGTLVQDFEEVVRQMNALNGMWSGQAHDALLQRFGEDQRTVQNMLEYMKALSEDLNFADQEYVRCEGAVSGIIDVLRL
ncbi:MAG: WXG100 family type VII secretion target [Lachnospiraceae bacterium]|nr:WXG100 family type VII secretion target [Lachnospiraceae bacterium]